MRRSDQDAASALLILLTVGIVGIAIYNAHYTRRNYEVNAQRLDDHPTSNEKKELYNP
jgi:hypothetical protein